MSQQKTENKVSLQNSTAQKNTTDNGDVKYSFGVSQSEINDYVEAAYAKENTEDYKKYAEPSERLLNDVANEIDIDGYSHALRDNDIRHIRNSHGEETNEKYPVTKDDIKLIPWIVENYDKVFVKTNAKNQPGIVYVKVIPDNIIYYVEAVTEEYHKEKLLINKQMLKVGIDEIPNLHGLIAAINKKTCSSQYLADLEKIRKAYVRDVKVNYSNDILPRNYKKSSGNAKYSLSEDFDIEQLLFDDNFYSLYEKEEKSIINKSKAELQAELKAINENYTDDDLKLFYYRGLKEWSNEKCYLIDTCLTSQDKFKNYLDYFRIQY